MRGHPKPLQQKESSNPDNNGEGARAGPFGGTGTAAVSTSAGLGVAVLREALSAAPIVGCAATAATIAALRATVATAAARNLASGGGAAGNGANTIVGMAAVVLVHVKA